MTGQVPGPNKRRPLIGLLCCFCLLGAGCSADIAWVDFAQLQRAASPNDALACPAGFCAAPADFVTEAVASPAAELAAKVAAILAAQPRTEAAMRSDDGLRFVFVQRSRLFRFPDTVNVAVIPIDAGHSGIAIYSRSNYGYGDFGVNRARIADWLRQLDVAAAPAS